MKANRHLVILKVVAPLAIAGLLHSALGSEVGVSAAPQEPGRGANQGSSLEAYLAGLPMTDAIFPGLDSVDARVWTELFGSFDRNLLNLRDSARKLEAQLTAKTASVSEATRTLRAAEQRSSQRAIELQTAVAGLRRVQTQSGVSTGVMQREVDRAEKAQAALDTARSEEADARKQLSTIEAETSQVRLAREATLLAVERATRDLGPPMLDAIKGRELRLGDKKVAVLTHSSVNDKIGVAECDGPNPVVVIAQRSTHPLAFAGLMFFREHELAHHVLKHIDCSQGRRLRSGGPEQELAADCEAARVLASFPDGIRVVDIIYGHLFGWALPATASHPSTQARANALYLQCPASPLSDTRASDGRPRRLFLQPMAIDQGHP